MVLGVPPDASSHLSGRPSPAASFLLSDDAQSPEAHSVAASHTPGIRAYGMN